MLCGIIRTSRGLPAEHDTSQGDARGLRNVRAHVYQLKRSLSAFVRPQRFLAQAWKPLQSCLKGQSCIQRWLRRLMHQARSSRRRLYLRGIDERAPMPCTAPITRSSLVARTPRIKRLSVAMITVRGTPMFAHTDGDGLVDMTIKLRCLHNPARSDFFL
jgi:hypothetical protein